jgi:hypothetical protein
MTKIPLGVVLVAAVLLAVIAFSSCSHCKKFQPYSPSVWSDVGKFEGMSDMKATSYSSYPENAVVAGSVLDAFNVANTQTNQGAGPAADGVRLWGFGSSLFSSPDNNRSIDMYGPTAGSTTCFGRSFGLSKSTGPLCVNQEQYRLMTTRGQNATGGAGF